MNPLNRHSPRLFLLLTLCALSLQLHASALQPFAAEYELYRGNSHIGKAKFDLAYEDGIWTWQTVTRPVGFYRLLTKKKPFEETRMRPASQQLQLLLHRKGDDPQKTASESAYFDHEKGLIYYHEDKKNRQLQLPADIFNYHSIHLLYPHMLDEGLTQQDIMFYKNGKLSKSQVRLDRQHELTRDGDKLIVDRLTQSFNGKKNKMIYYYQSGSVVPVKIEQLKPGKAVNVLWRISYQ